MNSVLPFLPGQHDIRLVLLAVIIAAATSFVTFIAYAHLLARSSGRHGGWLLLTAICAATGIWTAHVVMALSLVAAKQSYQPLFAALSFAAALGSATAGIALSSRKGRMMAVSGGAVLGLGAPLTHFVGMRAFPLTGAPDLSPVLACSAALAAIVFSGAAMLAFREYLGKPALALASALLTAGLCIFLFTAMAAIGLPNAVVDPLPDERLTELLLACVAAGMAAFVLIGGYAAAMLDGKALRANYSQFGELVDAIEDGIIIALNGQIVSVNSRILKLTGRKQHELAGKQVHGDLLAVARRSASSGAVRKFQASLVTSTEETVPVQVARHPLHAMARANEVYAVRDLRERAEAAERVEQLTGELAQCQRDLRRRNFLLEGVINNMSQGLCMFDADKRVVLSNDRYAAIYDLSPEAIKPGSHLQDIVQKRIEKGLYAGASPKAYAEDCLAPIEKTGDMLHKLSDGRLIAVNRRIMPGGGWVTTHEDITERRRMEEENQHLTEHDTLTMLPNRASLRRLLDEMVAAAAPKKRRLAVLMLNLDCFREVNDTLGHPMGDLLLKAVADRLRSHTRKATLLARFGDDEFVLVESVDQPGRDASALAGRIQDQLRLPFNLDGTTLSIDTTIGITIAPTDGKDADTLLKRADLALYRAKKEARGTHYFFDATMEKHLKERLGLEKDLGAALAKAQFELHYQPLVSLSNTQISGFEAFLRWNHPTRGVVPPDAFLPVAEATGLMPSVGEWIFRQACSEAAQWPEPLKVAINVSPSQFKARDFVRIVIGALAASGLAAQRLEVEISEKLIQQDPEGALTTLRQLSDAGVRIALDDFGTGFTSLTYLRRYPIHRIKIDRAFVTTLSQEPDSQLIVRTLARMGAGFKVATSAEGVETQAQFDLVRAEGCTEMQGYFFSPPRTAGEIRALFMPKADSAVA